MPHYLKLGEVPRKRHIRMPRPTEESFLGEGLAYEHIVTTEGFNRAYSIMYHLRPPTRNTKIEFAGAVRLQAAPELALRHHHFKTHHLERGGDPITGRVPMLFNNDLASYRVRPLEQQAELFRNGAADEIVYIQEGSGRLESTFGVLPYRRGDYVVIPRATTYRFVSDAVEREEHLVIESYSPVRTPARYHNPDGQLMLGAPFYERDFHGPTELLVIDEETETSVVIKDKERLTRVTLPHHPFDVIGWDGYSYPYTFNAWDFEPLTGTVHLPPPFQQTFETGGFVVCTFAPRYLDHHPEAIKVPYAHSNVEADEVLFYVDGEFGSRRGVELGSMTLHPGGIPHGPHPGTIMRSMDMERTDEMAVMFDTFRPLYVAVSAMAVDDPEYPYSWMEK